MATYELSMREMHLVLFALSYTSYKYEHQRFVNDLEERQELFERLATEFADAER